MKITSWAAEENRYIFSFTVYIARYSNIYYAPYIMHYIK